MKPHRPPLSESDLQRKLDRMGQRSLFETWKSLTARQKENFLYQFHYLDEELFRRQQSLLREPKEKPIEFEPFTNYEIAKNEEDKEQGLNLLSQGKCACLIVSGGQGSRLRFSGPKGCFPITLIKRKTLFQLFAEKILWAGKRSNTHLECAIMTSPLNHVETELFFDQHAFFGLPPPSIHFFYQDVGPFLNLEGNLFFDAPGQLAVGPNGNGGALRRLSESGILKEWKKKGIEFVNFIPIDNPLADPFDTQLIGFHARHNNEVSIKAIARKDPNEKVGILVNQKGKTHVVEYSEFPSEEKKAVANNAFKHPLANVSLFCFSIDFIERVASQALPLHLAKKSVKEWRQNQEIFPEEPNAWKFEEFIFDVLPFSDRVSAIVYPRESCFAPLKNLEGEDSISTVQAALLAADRNTFFSISGRLPSDEAIFELDQGFYYPTDAIKSKWGGRELPTEPYVEAL